jgi:hypothetical protein
VKLNCHYLSSSFVTFEQFYNIINFYKQTIQLTDKKEIAWEWLKEAIGTVPL